MRFFKKSFLNGVRTCLSVNRNDEEKKEKKPGGMAKEL